MVRVVMCLASFYMRYHFKLLQQYKIDLIILRRELNHTLKTCDVYKQLVINRHIQVESFVPPHQGHAAFFMV